MIILNLLPPTARANITRFQWFSFFKQIAGILIAGVACSAIFILGTQWWFAQMVQEYETSLSAFENLLTKAKKQPMTMKQQQLLLNTLSEIQKNEVDWIPWIQTITSKIPQDIKLKTLAFDQKNQSVTLSGQSSSRASVLELKNQIETLPHIQRVDLPLSSIFSEEQPAFTLTISLSEWK